MKSKFILPSGAFILTLAAHFYFSTNNAYEIAEKWVKITSFNPVDSYMNQQGYFLGFSYAAAAAFTVYAILNFTINRKAGVAGTISGLTLTGILYFAVCFLTGCCGSPMLTVYLSLLGSSFIGFAKPVTASLTLISVAVGFVWIRRNNKKNIYCDFSSGCCDVKEIKVERIVMEKNIISNSDEIKEVYSELAEGISLKKCRQCGCMKETLESIEKSVTDSNYNDIKEIHKLIKGWMKEITGIKYSCLGCEHCYPAAALNLLNEKYPSIENEQLSCALGIDKDKWPYIAGEFYAFCGGDYCPVAVSTLGDTELADRLAKNHPEELCIVGKTETENIGIDKVIKNTITNPTIKYLLLVGTEPKGHKSGETFVELIKNGVDDKMRVIGSTAKKPFLRNVTIEEINSFRNQVELVNMIGCIDDNLIINKIKEVAAAVPGKSVHQKQSAEKINCGCSSCSNEKSISKTEEPAVKRIGIIQAKEPSRIIMDKSGYFVILPIPDKNIIKVEHYSYDNSLLRVIEGKDARSIYWTIIENKWVTLLSHAAYLGKELKTAELSIRNGSKYIQDGA